MPDVGECRYCDEPFGDDDEIVEVPEEGPWHAECFAEVAEVEQEQADFLRKCC